jgi:hypothetical protein
MGGDEGALKHVEVDSPVLNGVLNVAKAEIDKVYLPVFVDHVGCG